jgi:hypothetical protein
MKVGILATLFAGLLLVGLPLTSMAGPAPDTDGDGVPDVIDNCKLVSNAAPDDCDTDSDGYGNICDCDYTTPGPGGTGTDYLCGGPDFGLFLADFGGADGGTGTDQNCDGLVGGPDFGLFLGGFGGAPGPSGLSCAGSVPCP